MNYNIQSLSNYFSDRLPAELPAFLWTELIPDDKEKKELSAADLLFSTGQRSEKLANALSEKKGVKKTRKLAIADALLWQTRVFTKYDKVKINYSGDIKDKKYDEEWAIPKAITTLSFSIAPFWLHCGNKVAVLAIIPVFTAAVSLNISKGYDLVRLSWKYMDENYDVNFLGKGLSVISWLAISVFSIAMPLSVCPGMLKTSQTKIALGALGYVAATFAAGASLKLYEYHNNPAVYKAYNQYIKNIK